MGIYFRLLFLTLPLFTGLSIIPGFFFSEMFNSEYERAFLQKWKSVPVLVDSFSKVHPDSWKRSLDQFIQNEGAPAGMLALYREGDQGWECIWDAKEDDCTSKSTDRYPALESEGMVFKDKIAYITYLSQEKNLKYLLIADDHGRDGTLIGYKRNFLITVFVAIVLSFFVPFVFSTILNRQIQKIGKGGKSPVIREIRDLDQTFRIMKESLEDLRRRNAGMLRSGVELGSHYRNGETDEPE